MKNPFISLCVGLALITIACSEDDSADHLTTLKNVSECELSIETTTLVGICVEGTDAALPDEIIMFVSTFYSKGDNPSNTIFDWSIQSGSMEILTIDTSVDGLIAKSIATIRFNTDYTGQGIIKVNAENETGSGSDEHLVGLNSND